MTITRGVFVRLSRMIFPAVISLSFAACSTGKDIGVSADGLVPGATTGPGQIELSWVAPVEREDGTPTTMAKIADYKVYYGPSQGNYTNQVSISGGYTMQVTLSSLAKGTYYLVVTTLDVDGRGSAHSQAVFGSV